MSLRDLAAATGLTAVPVATEVTRWIGGLPQYPVGHLGRVARIREEVAKLRALRVCGAVYDGVGIPACIASAHRAADEIARDITGDITRDSAGNSAGDSGADTGEIIATPTLVQGTGSEAGQ